MNIEMKIIGRIVDRALERGYDISVNDGEGDVLIRSKDKAKILAEVGASDETLFRVFNKHQRVGIIWFVHGNEEDVVADCSDVPEILELVD